MAENDIKRDLLEDLPEECKEIIENAEDDNFILDNQWGYPNDDMIFSGITPNVDYYDANDIDNFEDDEILANWISEGLKDKIETNLGIGIDLDDEEEVREDESIWGSITEDYWDCTCIGFDLYSDKIKNEK